MSTWVVKTPGSDCALDKNVPLRQQLLVLIGKSQSSVLFSMSAAEGIQIPPGEPLGDSSRN